VKIADEAHTQPDLLSGAPHVPECGDLVATVSRIDEASAAKQLVLCCRPISLPQAK